jgi:hypothetical protein
VSIATPFDIAAFLDEPLRPAQVASVSPSGRPVLGSFWFVFAEGRFWFSSRPETPICVAVARGAEVAVIVDEFSPPDSIRQIRILGDGRLEPHDPIRCNESMADTSVPTSIAGLPSSATA